jgi:hypothetical protein
MRRRCIVACALVFFSTVASALPAGSAPPGFSVLVIAHTDFGPAADEFDSSILGCTSGTVVDGRGGAHFTPWGGAFVGLKEFTCDGGSSGFTVRLTARFGPGGSTGHWTLVDAWGGLAGLKGSGSLVGIPTGETSIDDVYTGTFR